MTSENEINKIDKNDINDIITGLSRPQKMLPSKLFYDEAGSKLFDQICELEEYYPTRTEIKIMEENIEEIASVFDDESVLIEFGSGSSLKTKLLLDHLNGIAGYVPIDISEQHLMQTANMLHAEFPNIDIYPVAADYTQPLDLPPIAKKVSHKIAYFPGSTIGNFAVAEARKFLGVIHNLVGDNGGLLIGADLKKDIKILEAAYNDKQNVTADFNLNLLKRLNRELSANFELDKFEHKAIYDEKFGRIEMHLIAKDDLQFQIAQQTFSMKRGDSILTEYSHKYTIEEFADLVSDHFNVSKVWTDSRNLFSVQFLTTK